MMQGLRYLGTVAFEARRALFSAPSAHRRAGLYPWSHNFNPLHGRTQVACVHYMQSGLASLCLPVAHSR